MDQVHLPQYKTIARFDKNLQFDGPCVKFHQNEKKKKKLQDICMVAVGYTDK